MHDIDRVRTAQPPQEGANSKHVLEAPQHGPGSPARYVVEPNIRRQPFGDIHAVDGDVELVTAPCEFANEPKSHQAVAVPAMIGQQMRRVSYEDVQPASYARFGERSIGYGINAYSRTRLRTPSLCESLLWVQHCV